jgi:ribosomal-protein-alanine N-acetyltransferase
VKTGSDKGLQTTFKLRLFKPSDLDKVICINRVCLPENYSPYFFTNLYKRYPATFIVAEKGREVVGYVMCRIESGFMNFGLFGSSKKSHVVSIAVLPEYQQKGIGKALMNKVMKNMSIYDAKECILEVRVSNTTAINMYKHLDFQIIRTKTAYYTDGEAAHIMEKKL